MCAPACANAGNPGGASGATASFPAVLRLWPRRATRFSFSTSPTSRPRTRTCAGSGATTSTDFRIRKRDGTSATTCRTITPAKAECPRGFSAWRSGRSTLLAHSRGIRCPSSTNGRAANVCVSECRPARTSCTWALCGFATRWTRAGSGSDGVGGHVFPIARRRGALVRSHASAAPEKQGTGVSTARARTPAHGPDRTGSLPYPLRVLCGRAGNSQSGSDY